MNEDRIRRARGRTRPGPPPRVVSGPRASSDRLVGRREVVAAVAGVGGAGADARAEAGESETGPLQRIAGVGVGVGGLVRIHGPPPARLVRRGVERLHVQRLGIEPQLAHDRSPWENGDWEHAPVVGACEWRRDPPQAGDQLRQRSSAIDLPIPSHAMARGNGIRRRQLFDPAASIPRAACPIPAPPQWTRRPESTEKRARAPAGGALARRIDPNPDGHLPGSGKTTRLSWPSRSTAATPKK